MKPLSVAAIPIRSTSTRVPNKNFRELAGRPLWQWIVKHALEAEVFTLLILDCDKPGLVELPKGLQELANETETAIEIIERLDFLLDGNGNDLIYSHAQVAQLHWSIAPEEFMIFQLFATAPFLSVSSIRQCVRVLEPWYQHPNYSVLTAVEEAGWYWPQKGLVPYNYRPDVLPKSQDASVLKESTGLYGCWSDWVLNRQTRIAERPMFCRIPQIEALDIDTEFDWEVAEAMANKYLVNET